MKNYWLLDDNVTLLTETELIREAFCDGCLANMCELGVPWTEVVKSAAATFNAIPVTCEPGYTVIDRRIAMIN